MSNATIASNISAGIAISSGAFAGWVGNMAKLAPAFPPATYASLASAALAGFISSPLTGGDSFVDFAANGAIAAAAGAKTAYIEPGSPWENGYCESFNARFRDELLDGETFYSLKEAQFLIEQWRKHYNTKRPHSALGYRPPAPETIIQMDRSPVMH